jgi:hypothetical protein
MSNELKTQSRVFNDDLLMNSGDLQYVQSQFPDAFHLLDHKTLRDTFVRYEKVANQAGARVRRLGLFAIISGTFGLLSAATEPLWHSLACEKVLTIVFEFCGFGAAVIAGGGLLLGPWRKQWLEARFMTERLRQWHFQLLVRKSSEVEASLNKANANAQADFRKKREQWFSDFLHDFEGKLYSRMLALVDDANYSGDWLHNPATIFNHNSPVLPTIFDAYKRLRFSHQYDYATHKLSDAKDNPFWQFLKWPPLRQESAIRGVVSFCFVTALLCSIGVILNREFDIKPAAAPYLDSLTLAIAIVGVALRTLQDGLGITKDLERYRDYRGKVNRLQIYFDQSTDPEKKVRLMEEMELTAVDEMKGFLRTHREGAFLL